MRITKSRLRHIIQESLKEVLVEREMGNVTPVAGDSIESAEISVDPSKETVKSQLSDVAMAVKYLGRINNPQEQIEAIPHLFAELFGLGGTEDTLSQEQRVNAIRKSLELAYSNAETGPLVSAIRNLLNQIK